jgi:hypothetical protein
MKRFFEKWYVLFMLMKIARYNKIRQKFENKYDEYVDGYGQRLEYIRFVKCHEKDGKLYKLRKDGSNDVVASKPQRDDFGLYEYVDQHCGYCEDDFYGTIWTKTPFKGFWLERGFHC